MNTLFDISPQLPAGFSYTQAFITESEETQLLDIIAGIPVDTMKFHQYEAKRKVASFGQSWNFTEKRLSKAADIPASFHFLLEKVVQQLNISIEEIAQLLVTEYPVGSVINWHRDAPPFDTIVGISLLSDCTFRLRPHDPEKQTRSATISLPVKRRSMYVMQGAAKNDWQHSTLPVTSTRYSLTFRTLKK